MRLGLRWAGSAHFALVAVPRYPPPSHYHWWWCCRQASRVVGVTSFMRCWGHKQGLACKRSVVFGGSVLSPVTIVLMAS